MRCSTSITAIEPRNARMRSPSSRTSSAPRPPGRLVEQQQPRLADECARERDALLHRVGERLRQPAATSSQPSSASVAERALAQRALVAIGARQAEQRAHHAGAAEALGADHHVLEHGQPGNSPMPCSVRAMPSWASLSVRSP